MHNLPPALVVEVLQALLPEGYVITAPGESPTDEPMNEEQAAAYLQSTPGVMRSMHTNGDGPVYRKVGRKPVYLKSDIDAWLHAQPGRRSSAECRFGK